MAKSPQPRMEINLEEIYQILDSARRQPMSEANYEKVKTAVSALAERAAPGPRTTEKTRAEPPKGQKTKPGHGRNGAAKFTGAKRITVAHATLQTVNGAEVGDLFMSLIHTCELNGVNPFDYLTELLRHAEELKTEPVVVDALELPRDLGPTVDASGCVIE